MRKNVMIAAYRELARRYLNAGAKLAGVHGFLNAPDVYTHLCTEIRCHPDAYHLTPREGEAMVARIQHEVYSQGGLPGGPLSWIDDDSEMTAFYEDGCQFNSRRFNARGMLCSVLAHELEDDDVTA